jgi:hypothetical protein
MWVFDAAAQTWANVSAQTGAVPSARLYHSASAQSNANSSFYIFGGTDVGTGMLNDLYLLTLSGGSGGGGGGEGSWAASWRVVDAGAALPGPRAGHSQSALPPRASGAAPDGSFVVFGGESEDATLGDAWIFRPAASATTGAFTKVQAGGGPGPRNQHAALAIALPLPGGAGSARALVVSGGSDAGGDDRDDVWLLSLDSSPPAWQQIGARGAALAAAWPSVRHGHAMWGGVAPAEAAGAVELSFLIFGGGNSSVPDPANFLGDVWRFSATLSAGADGSVTLAGPGAYSLVDAGGPGAPSPRALGGVVADGGGQAPSQILASGFSGYNGGTDDRLHNDVWQWSDSGAFKPLRGDSLKH